MFKLEEITPEERESRNFKKQMSLISKRNLEVKRRARHYYEQWINEDKPITRDEMENLARRAILAAEVLVEIIDNADSLISEEDDL